MDDVGVFYEHLVYLTAKWYIFGHLVHFAVIWYIFPILVYCTEKKLATLLFSRISIKFFSDF
jgi:hypothetical protein